MGATGMFVTTIGQEVTDPDEGGDGARLII